MRAAVSSLAGVSNVSASTSSPRLVVDTPPPSEADPLGPLIDRVRDGDLLAFEALYRRTREATYRVLYQLVGQSPDMEDLIQETYVQLLSAVRRYRGEARFSTFLHRVCANVGLMYLRSRKRRPEDMVAEVPEQPAGNAFDPEHKAQASEAARMMQAALEKLTPKKRVVFVYHELMGMGPEEIAEAVDTSPNTVRSRLFHARKEFAQAVSRMRRDSYLMRPMAAVAGGRDGAS